MLYRYLIVAAVLLLSHTAFAGGTGGPIPDGDSDGIESSIAVADTFLVEDVSVSITELTHSWSGDLTISLIHNEVEAILLDRLGRVSGSGFGDSSDFDGDYNFNDAFEGDLWDVAANLGSTAVITPDDYFPTTTDGTVNLLNTALGGVSAAGDWTLKIVDISASDSGMFVGWTLTLNDGPIGNGDAGDFNNDNVVDNLDIDLMRGAVINMTADARFNIDNLGDPTIPDENDFVHLIEDIMGTVQADGNLDKTVNFEDYVLLSNGFNMTGTDWIGGNFNTDTETNFEDFVLLSNRFGETCPCTSPEAASVPEPGSILGFLAVGSGLFAVGRRRFTEN